eukprot:762597-Hanusia_phi.AAC.4
MNQSIKITNFFPQDSDGEEERSTPLKLGTARTASLQDKRHVVEVLDEGNKVLLVPSCLLLVALADSVSLPWKMYNAEREFFSGRLIKFWYLDMIGKTVGTGHKYDKEEVRARQQ